MSEAASAPATEANSVSDAWAPSTPLHRPSRSGPMFSTAVVLGFVSAPVTGAGFNTALAVLVAGLGVLAIAYAISLFARQYQGAGAVYEYLVRGAHPAIGILTAGVFFMGTLFLGGGGIYLGLGILTNGSGPSTSRRRPCRRGGCLSLLFLALVVALNYIGVRIAIGAMLTFAALSFTPMLILAMRSSPRANEHARPSSTPAPPRCTPSSTA